MSAVLVVDDKEMLRDSVGATLQRAGHVVVAASDAAQALELVHRRRPDAVVTDLKMPGMSGVDLLERIREFDEDLPVVLMTAFGDVPSAVRAMKLGAFDYLSKPFEGDELIIAVKRAIEHARLKRENAALRAAAGADAPLAPAAAAGAAPGARRGLDRIIGESAAMRALKDQIRAIAASHGTALITGESGVGKEAIARAIHELSPRASEPFLAMNCPALAESLLESELFGHEKGAFTGADRLRKGRFELADRGTLLLDEVSEVSPQIQAKLLRVLQEREFERVGSSTTISVDVRVIATTNRDLPSHVSAGGFREDLFYRLNVLPIAVPPLRDRADDIPLLVERFVRDVALREGGEAPAVRDDAMHALCAYRWPGNVRELQNLCERAVVLSRRGPITADLVGPWLRAPAVGAAPPGPVVAVNGHAANGHARVGPPPAANTGSVIESAPFVPVLDRTLEEIERDAIVRTLQRFNGHRQRTAEALGIGVRTLGLKLKKWKELRLVAETL